MTKDIDPIEVAIAKNITITDPNLHEAVYMTVMDALSQQDKEIERLRKALHYEANRFSRIGTHAPDCWKWGPQHYECALRYIKDHTENWSEHD